MLSIVSTNRVSVPHRFWSAGRRARPVWQTFVVLLLGAMACRAVHAQLLVGVDAARRLPRPAIWHPPHTQPTPPASTYKIKELNVHANIDGSIAQVQVGQTFVNTGSVAMQVQFVFPLPYDGAVSQLTFMVDGKEYEGKLMDAKEARAIYEAYVRKHQDPALMEWIGWGMFQTSVFPVPPGASRTVTLKYVQVCDQHQAVSEFLFPLATAKYTSETVEKVRIAVHLQSEHPIGNIYSPSQDVDIERPSKQRALVTYEMKDSVPQHDFRLFWDVGKKALQSQVISYRASDDEDGYFLLLLRPGASEDDDRPRGKKTVVFVLDRSGSMNGKKIEQAKGALKFVLNNLRDGDLFNIIAYDREVEQFRPELQKYDQSIHDSAMGFVESIHAGGSTNIDGALKSALAQLQPESGPAYVIFLTDGLPTTGEQNEAKIVENAKENNDAKARVFSFGVGYDVNSRLLDKLSRDNFGRTEFVRPDEDLEAVVSRFYDRIGTPVLTDVSIAFTGIREDADRAVNRMYPKQVWDLFAGEQVVVVGRYPKSGSGSLVLRGTGAEGSEKHTWDFEFAKTASDKSMAFVARLWATRRIGEIIDQIDLEGKNEELVDELVELSKKHGILTPYTSFLADDRMELAQNPGAARREALRELDKLQVADGQRGFVQRDFKTNLKSARLAQPVPTPSDSTSFAAGAVSDAAASPERADPAASRARVLQVGTKAFYRRGQRWVEAGISPEEEKSAVTVARFSEDYFKLVDQYGNEVSQYLAIDGPVTLRLDGKVYAF